jgi:hypothetical protein
METQTNNNFNSETGNGEISRTEGVVGGSEADVLRFEGRRCLIIGLGSAGARISNQIIERMIGNYGNPNALPWVRFLCLETGNVPAEKLVRRHATFHHLQVGRTDYQSLIANPEQYRAELDFERWRPRGGIESADSIEDGANGIRALGRLAILFKSNYNQIMTSIRTDLDALNQLNQQDASRAFSHAVKQPASVTLDGSKEQRQISVYVVGTLAGGTGSGAFIDLGYMLQNLLNQNYNISSTGIFLLPSAQENDPRRVGNAMSALVELNHYSSEQTRYEAQFPDSPGRPYRSPTRGERPYRYIYLAQTRGAGQEEYPRLLTATADYLYFDLLGSSTRARDNRRADISEFFIQRDYFGAPQKLLTFGMAGIEFPFTKVLRGCSLKLAQIGFTALIGPDAPLTDSERDGLLKRIPLLRRNALMERLLKVNDRPLDVLFDEAIQGIRESALISNTPMAIIREQIDVAFGVANVEPHPKLPPKIVPQTIEDNSLPALNQMIKDLKDCVQYILLDTSGGIRMLRKFLELVCDELQPSKSRGVTDFETEQARVSAAQENTATCREDMFLKLSLATRAGVTRYADEFLEAINEYVHSRLRSTAAPSADSIRSDVHDIVVKWRYRIENTKNGAEKLINQLVPELAALAKATDVEGGIDEWSRVVNGTELFTPNKTIPEEYERCLEQTANYRKITLGKPERELALGRAAVRSFAEEFQKSILMDVNSTGRFDESAGSLLPHNEDTLLAYAEPSQEVFVWLRQRSVIERILQRTDRNEIVAELKAKSEPFLEWDSASPRYFSHPGKRYGFTFYNHRDPNLKSFNDLLNNARLFAGFDGKVENGDIADMHQITVLREHGAFSLGTLKQLREDTGSHWWITYQEQSNGVSRHSRGDVDEWVNWTRADERNRVRLRSEILVGVAIGKIEFISGREYRFNYERNLPSEKGFIELTNDLEDATLKIQKEKKAGELSRKISEYRRDYGAPEVAKKIVQLIEEKDGQFSEFDIPLDKKGLEMYLIDYIENDVELKSAYEHIFPNKVENSYRKQDASTGELAYFCPNLNPQKPCGKKLGYTAQSLYTTIIVGGRSQRVRRCPFCKEDIP